MKKKILTVLTCVLGIAGIFYGILMEHNRIFVGGIICVVGGYLIIRKELKKLVLINERESSYEDTEKDQ